MDKPKDIVRSNIECSILSIDLDIKLLRKHLLKETNEETSKAIEQQLEQLEYSKGLLVEKLGILKLAKK